MRSIRASNNRAFRRLSCGAEVSFDRRKLCNSLGLTTPRSSSEFRQDPVFPRGGVGGANEPCSQQVAQCRPRDCRRVALRRAAPGTGLCAVNLVQESVRHRNQFVIPHNKAVVHGLSSRGQALASGRRQRGTRLAHAGLQACIQTPRERSAGFRVGGRGLRAWHPRPGHYGLLYLALQEGHGCSAGVSGDCRPQHSFKWIKRQSINRCPGSSEYAAKTKIRCAIATRPVIAIVKRELHLDTSLSTPLQILSASVFETPPFRCDFQPDRIETVREAFR